MLSRRNASDRSPGPKSHVVVLNQVRHALSPPQAHRGARLAEKRPSMEHRTRLDGQHRLNLFRLSISPALSCSSFQFVSLWSLLLSLERVERVKPLNHTVIDINTAW